MRDVKARRDEVQRRVARRAEPIRSWRAIRTIARRRTPTPSRTPPKNPISAWIERRRRTPRSPHQAATLESKQQNRIRQRELQRRRGLEQPALGVRSRPCRNRQTASRQTGLPRWRSTPRRPTIPLPWRPTGPTGRSPGLAIIGSGLSSHDLSHAGAPVREARGAATSTSKAPQPRSAPPTADDDPGLQQQADEYHRHSDGEKQRVRRVSSGISRSMSGTASSTGCADGFLALVEQHAAIQRRAWPLAPDSILPQRMARFDRRNHRKVIGRAAVTDTDHSRLGASHGFLLASAPTRRLRATLTKNSKTPAARTKLPIVVIRLSVPQPP